MTTATPDDRHRLSDEEPIEVGWYRYSGGAQVMIFHLRLSGQWSAHFDNGTAADCAWGYIEQALGVWNLDLIDGPAGLAARAQADPAPEQRPHHWINQNGRCDNGQMMDAGDDWQPVYLTPAPVGVPASCVCDSRRPHWHAPVGKTREQIAQAWDEGFKQGGPMHDENYDDPDAHTRNPYRIAAKP